MNLIDFIFKLVHKFVPMSAQEFAKMKAEGEDWYSSIRIDAEALKEPKNKLLGTAKLHAEKWYIKLTFAILFIILSKKITDWLASTPQTEDDDE